MPAHDRESSNTATERENKASPESVPASAQPREAHCLGIDAVPDARPPEAPPFDINPDLDGVDRKKFEDALRTIPRAFASDSTAIPAPAPGVSHSIHLTDGKPIKLAAYRQSPQKQAAVRAAVKSLLDRGLIEESNSPWSAPVVLVPKPHAPNKWRMCIDYRKLNARTRKDAYPIPLIENCVDACKDADFFTLIDIKDAFHHVPMDEASIPLTAFVTPDGLFQWRRMPMGLTNAPATFQRYVDARLRGLLGVKCTAFFDDCLVYTKGTLEDHIRDVLEVLQRLADSGLEASLEKCKFGYKELLFVGYVLGKGTLRPDLSKIRAVQDFPEPKNLSELRAFLGLCNFYHKFIPGYATIALPLYKLTRKGVHFDFSSHDVQHAFQELKKALVSAPCLYTPDHKLPFVLSTDASALGLGAVLSQEVNGETHPIAYISRQLNAAERNYSGTELECLAVVWAVGQFETYLLDKRFTLVTDHSALMWLPTKKLENSRAMRWALKLQEFTFDVKHRPGSQHRDVDALSRNPVPNSAPPDDTTADPAIGPRDVRPRYVRTVLASRLPFQTIAEIETSHVCPTPSNQDHARFMTAGLALAAVTASAPFDGNLVLVDESLTSDLAHRQRADPQLNEIIDYLNTKAVPASARGEPNSREKFISQAESYVLLPTDTTQPNETLLHYLPKKPRRGLSALAPFLPRVVVPRSLVPEIIELYHDSAFGGHFGIKRTLRRLMATYFWSTLLRDVTAHINSCKVCTAEKTRRRLLSVPARAMEPPKEPGEVFSMDFIQMTHKSEDFQWVLVIIDHFSRWAIAIPVLKPTAEVVAQVLFDEVFNKFGLPRRLLSDRGSNFNSTIVRSLNQLLGVKTLLTSAYHPQANGMVERLNATLKDTLRATCEQRGSQWIQSLQAAVFAYNTSVSEATGYSPYFVLFGRHPRVPGDVYAENVQELDTATLEAVPEYVSWMLSNAQDCHTFLRTLLASKMDTVERARQKFGPFPTFKIGDRVWIRYHTASGQSKKAGWFGPGVIIEKMGDTGTTYKVEHQSSTSKRRIKIQSVIHAQRLLPYHERLPQVESPVPDPSPPSSHRGSHDDPSLVPAPEDATRIRLPARGRLPAPRAEQAMAPLGEVELPPESVEAHPPPRQDELGPTAPASAPPTRSYDLRPRVDSGLLSDDAYARRAVPDHLTRYSLPRRTSPTRRS